MPTSPVNPAFRQTVQAILLGLVGWSAFSCADTLSKWLAQSYSVSEIIALTAAVMVAVSGLWTLVSYGPRAFITPFLKWHGVRSMCTAATSFCVISALAHIPLADFYGIIFLSPLMLCVMAYFFLGESIGWHRIAAVIAGFIGVLIIAGPQFDTYNTGILFAVAAIFAVSLTGVAARKMKDENVLPLFAFYPSLLNVLIHTPLMLHDFKMPAAADIPLFLVVTPVLLTAFMCYSLAFKRIHETAILAPFQYVQMIWGIVLGYILFGDLPTAATLGGSAIIIVSGLYALWREHKSHHAVP